MKSVVAQSSTLAKAVEEAWNKAGRPEEFFIKILEEPTNGFLGFRARKAKVGLFFKAVDKKEDAIVPQVLKQESYSSYFNNQSLSIEDELSEIKAISVQSKQNTSAQSVKRQQKSAPQAAQVPIEQKQVRRIPSEQKKQSRPAAPSPVEKEAKPSVVHEPRKPMRVTPPAKEGSAQEVVASADDSLSALAPRKRYYRRRKKRTGGNGSGQASSSSDFKE